MAEIATTAAFSPQALDTIKDAGFIEKFFFLNYDKLTMFMPADHSEIPWTALIIGLWIPNFYYWGFNQYISAHTRRVQPRRRAKRHYACRVPQTDYPLHHRHSGHYGLQLVLQRPSARRPK